MLRLNIVINYPDDTDRETSLDYPSQSEVLLAIRETLSRENEASSFVFVVTPNAQR